MKRLVLLLTVITLSCLSQTIQAQDVHSPWTASLSTNAINNPTRSLTGDLGRYKTWNWDPAGFKIGLARHLKGRLSFESTISLSGIKQNYVNIDENFSLIALDGLFKYNLANSFVLTPYLVLGGGYTWLDTVGAGTLNAGVGINVWLTYNFGLTGQSIYKHAFEDYGLQHYQHSVGIIFKFGGSDNDNDGIVNKEDECPNIFGLAGFNGCPDTDKDGIPDKEDNCPDTPGTLNGCPDSDKDGVPDLYDNCPNLAGEKSNRGCPIPDTDKDGIIDTLDKCPKTKGSKNNNGCPEEKPEQTKAVISKKPVLIYFELSKAEIDAKSQKILDNIAKFIKQSDIKSYEISGHTDNTSSKQTNLKLSLERANAVRAYLVAKGVAETKLKTAGFGEEFPIDKTNSKAGKQKNRRVEIIPML
ncbi:OmpA family protein [Olleya namhaensis]|uniref:OmpA family protein n=1 Tax=Olleya namhaensis TaxID=1144750 RepID=UPI0024939705|nr:OmpA family protein [Olleya namhaensis]